MADASTGNMTVTVKVASVMDRIKVWVLLGTTLLFVLTTAYFASGGKIDFSTNQDQRQDQRQFQVQWQGQMIVYGDVVQGGPVRWVSSTAKDDAELTKLLEGMKPTSSFFAKVVAVTRSDSKGHAVVDYYEVLWPEFGKEKETEVK